MKKLLYLLSLTVVIGSSLFLSTCKKDEPDTPTITALTPSTGHEGDVVVISGTFLGSTHKIRFGGLDGVVIDPKGGEVTTQVPANSPLGKVDVSVETEGGSSNAMSFTVIPPAPEITSINPIKGGAGVTIDLTGKFFTTVTEVTFGTVKVTTFDPKTETHIVLKVPDGLPLGAIDITATSPSGISNKISFTVLAKPTITDFTPSSGIIGAHVLITGTSLEETGHIFFSSVDAPDFHINSSTLLDVVIPVGALSGKIKVVTTGGEVLSNTEFTVMGPPVITSFTPTAGVSGTLVTITGQNFSVDNATVKFGTTSAPGPTVNSDTEIKVNVPADASTGKISVTTDAGTGTSADNFSVVGPPTITNISPASGCVGSTVTITGTNFVNVTALKFNSTVVTAGNFTINSTTQITATVPVGATTGTISVTTPAGTVVSVTTFTVTGAPTITSFTPPSGPIGATITITGTNFVCVSSVKFNGTEVSAANYTVNPNTTQITAKVPVGASNGTLSVTTSAGTATSTNSFTVTGAPVITSFNPTSGIVGSTVTINGTDFTGATSVKFNGVEVGAANFTVSSAILITAKVPVGASNGPISVTTPAGTGISGTSFTVIGAPTVTSFNPTSGAVGANIVIAGTNFVNVTAVKFNGVDVGAGNYTVNSAIQITAKVPAGATNGVITVITAAGSGASVASFTIIIAPTVTSFAPLSGAVGQSVVVTGTSFTTATAVKFNGVAASTYTINNATQITVTIPAAATTGKISVDNPAGTGTSTNNFTVAPAPTISGFTPASGAVGATITINGANFVNVSSVKFNGTESGLGNIVVNSAVQLTAKVPAGAANGTISVTTPSGIGTSATSFTVILPPTISSFAPTSGIVGTSVVINGTNFTSATAVKFNGVAAGSFTVNSAIKITAAAPGALTTGPIAVTNPAGTATSSTNFTAILAPLISSISPLTGSPGTTLTITGSNLANATSVKFGATTVSVFVSNTDSQIKVIVPALAAGAVNVSVTTIAGPSNYKTFTVVPAPVITDIKPNVSYKGFPIMILGSNLASITGVKIGSYDATVMTAYDASVIATIPGSIPNGTYTVTALNDGGPSNGITLNIITAPSSVGSPPTGTYISPPPPNYINPVSNFWLDATTEDPAFFLATPGTTCQIENPSYATANPQLSTDQYVCGSYVFTKDGTGKVTANYIQLTIGYGHPATNLETFYGSWSATAVNNCYAKLIMISAKDGHVLIAHVEANFDPDCVP